MGSKRKRRIRPSRPTTETPHSDKSIWTAAIVLSAAVIMGLVFFGSYAENNHEASNPPTTTGQR